MDGFGELERKMTALGVLLSGSNLEAMTHKVAGAGKKDALAEIDQDLPGRKFTNWKPRLGAGYEIRSPGVAVLQPRPGGPSKVLTEGRSAGSTFSKRAGRTIGWGPTRGRGTWDDTQARVQRETPKRVAEQVHAQLAKVFT